MHTEKSEIYIPDDLYNAILTRLATVVPLFGDRDRLRIALGEVAGIWPEHCLEGQIDPPKITLAYAS
jgi:hypothetical protein